MIVRQTTILKEKIRTQVTGVTVRPRTRTLTVERVIAHKQLKSSTNPQSNEGVVARTVATLCHLPQETIMAVVIVTAADAATMGKVATGTTMMIIAIAKMVSEETSEDGFSTSATNKLASKPF